jgi:hypothetical protein
MEFANTPIMKNSKEQFGDARDQGWISVYLNDHDTLDGHAIRAIRSYLYREWRNYKHGLDDRPSIRGFAAYIDEPFDRIRRLIHRIPGMADGLGFTLDSKKRLTL